MEGEKYTIAYCNDFGFPVACKIIFKGFKLCTYAQYSDCVKLIFRPYKKRSDYSMTLYNQSFLIFKGWQDLKNKDIKDTISANRIVKVERSKYACFDSLYIDDMEKLLINPVVIYKDFKTGVNSKTYA